MEKLTFPIERTSAMHWMGVIYTGSVSGTILVTFLLLIGFMFMGSYGFAAFTIIFFVVFIAPMSVLIHKRLVKRGKMLMRTECEILIDGDTMKYRTGFPNTMDPAWKEIKITDKNRDILIKGALEKENNVGYHLQLSGKVYPEIKLGLWLDFDETYENARKLQKYLKGKIIEDLK